MIQTPQNPIIAIRGRVGFKFWTDIYRKRILPMVPTGMSSVSYTILAVPTVTVTCILILAFSRALVILRLNDTYTEFVETFAV